jgi:hypothetical protein
LAVQTRSAMKTNVNIVDRRTIPIGNAQTKGMGPNRVRI